MLENRQNNATSIPFAWHSAAGYLLASHWQNWRGPLGSDKAGNSRRTHLQHKDVATAREGYYLCKSRCDCADDFRARKM